MYRCMYVCVYIYIYIHCICVYIYIYIYYVWAESVEINTPFLSSGKQFIGLLSAANMYTYTPIV